MRRRRLCDVPIESGSIDSASMDSGFSVDSSMMFNWNDQDQVGGILWPDLSESEDHTVPHPMETVENALFLAEDYRKNKRYEDVTSDMRSTEQSSQAKNDDLSYKSESSSNFHTNEEHSSSGIEMDPWLVDFPNLCIALKEEYTDGNNHISTTELMNDLNDATNLSSVRGDSMQLDHEPDLFSHEDKENNDFLECDWATFGDFDDIEELFRKNDSIFGHDIIGDADGFLSPSKDVIDSTAQSIPMPNLPLCKEHASNEGCLSSQLDDHFDKQSSPSRKEKVDGHEIIPMAQSKAEGRKNRLSRNLKDNYYQHQHMPNTYLHSSITTPLQNFQLKATSEQMQFCDATFTENHGSSNQVTFTQHGYPTSYFPGMQLPAHLQLDRNQKSMPVHLQIDRNQKRAVPASYEVRSDDSKHPKTSNRLPDAKPVTMTPQEKMEKLRRRQQMQAQLAIEQQHQQYGYQIPSADIAVSKSYSQNNQLDGMTSTITTDECAHKFPSLELSMVVEKDESKRTSSLTYDPPAEETIYYQLQDVVGKLDMRIRLCIRDSLFRLARSATERQSASDMSSTNTSNKDEDEASTDEGTINHDRSMRLPDAETDTNPIDRIVANLLFQRPTEACPPLGSYEHLNST